MSKRKRYILAGFVFLLMVFSGLAWLYNLGIRAKGQMHHLTAASDAVVDELVSRELLEDTSQQDEREIYWDAIAKPIQPHIDPYDDLAITPLLIITAGLGIVVIVLLIPSRQRPS